jgi:hypothetical protein
MGNAVLDRRMQVGANGTVLLRLPESVRGQEVEIRVLATTSVPSEAELIETINRPLDSTLRKRYEVLMARRVAETLTPAEYEELQTLTDAVEGDHLRRWECVAKLAALRGQSPQEIATQFGLESVF